MTIDGCQLRQIERSSLNPRTARKLDGWMNDRKRNRPGYWVKWSRDVYAYREHTGEITYWRRVAGSEPPRTVRGVQP